MMLGDSLAQVVKDTTILKEVIVNVADTVTNYVYIKEVPMSDGWSTDTWMNFWGVIATFFAVLVALFGKEFFNWWNRINLEIIVPTEPLINNTLGTTNNYNKVYECILELKDKKGKKLIKNAKVKLKRYSWKEDKKIKIRNINGETLLPFITNNKNKTIISFLRKQEFILGYFEEYNNSIDFNQLAKITHNYLRVEDYFIKCNIYELEIISDNYFNNNKYYIQVYYERGKEGKLDELIRGVKIQVVDHISDFRDPIKHFNNNKVDDNS
jgi:hypothetical protein